LSLLALDHLWLAFKAGNHIGFVALHLTGERHRGLFLRFLPAAEPSWLHITAIERHCVGNVVVGHSESHARQTSHPSFERLMMSRKNRGRQVIKALGTVVTRVALPGSFRVIKATLDDVFGLPRGAGDTIGLA
jgi:hypothetical protein